eukprot:SAG11_NODE_17139_length_527_cov_0.969626_1_plen_23_part_01
MGLHRLRLGATLAKAPTTTDFPF